ncbi:MAG: signal transduction histidine kinase [Myxococcaceae bacterium]|nr:signal transduction histidine kinase [Myxococcaceae bacterium]
MAAPSTPDADPPPVGGDRFAKLGAQVLEAAPVVILVLDPRGAIQHVNPYFERLTGYRLDEIRGKDWFDTFLPDRDREHIRRLFIQAYGGERVRGGVNPILTRTGEERSIEWTDEMLRDSEGQPVGLLAIGHDVSERNAAQLALRLQEERYRVTVESMPDPLMLLDLDRRILHANPAAAQVMGTSPDWLAGKCPAEVLPEQEAQQIAGLFDRTVATREQQTAVITLSAQPTRARLVREITMVPLPGPDGQVRQVLSMSRDLTAQHQLVEDLRDADNRKNDFIAVLSHELRNPLSAIASSLSVLEQARGEIERTRSTALIERQVTLLTRLVDDLLDVSRITQNKIRLQRAPIDLASLVQAIVEDHRAQFSSLAVRLEARLPGGPLQMNGDAVRLTQMLGNLLDNAVKFTPTGGLTTVTLSRDEGTAVIRVVDSGAGIDPVMLDRLFQPFAQADRTLDRNQGGLGLGLAIVKGLVELHGGTVSVASSGHGRGAEFALRLPIDQVPERTPPPEQAPAARRVGRRVLVVEDNVDAAESLCLLLELEEHTVAVAHDGATGLRIAREFRPDLVLSDLGLPGMSGYDLARAFRQDEALRSVTLVALSGYASAADIEKSRAAGFDRHLPKPINLDRLRQVVETARHEEACPDHR